MVKQCCAHGPNYDANHQAYTVMKAAYICQRCPKAVTSARKHVYPAIEVYLNVQCVVENILILSNLHVLVRHELLTVKLLVERVEERVVELDFV